MSISRSKSAPHLQCPAASPSHASLPRHRSAVVLPVFTHPAFIQSRRVYREEDPFNLTDFFPQASLPGNTKEDEWSWLQYETGDGTELSASRLSSPISEEGEVLPPPSADGDNGTRETINHEDNIGVLALDDIPISPENDDRASDGDFLSVHAEENLPDDDALYNVLCELRRNHSRPQSPRAGDQAATLNQLFSPEKSESAEDVKLDGLEALVHQGMCRMFDLLDPQM